MVSSLLSVAAGVTCQRSRGHSETPPSPFESPISPVPTRCGSAVGADSGDARGVRGPRRPTRGSIPAGQSIDDGIGAGSGGERTVNFGDACEAARLLRCPHGGAPCRLCPEERSRDALYLRDPQFALCWGDPGAVLPPAGLIGAAASRRRPQRVAAGGPV